MIAPGATSNFMLTILREALLTIRSALSTVIPYAQSIYASCQVSVQIFRSIGFELALLLPRLQLLEELLRYEGMKSNHKTQLSIVLNHFETSVRDLQNTREAFDDRLT